jgi:PST family polysaccharide transporter
VAKDLEPTSDPEARGANRPETPTENGYVQIFRASALIGGSTAVGVVLGVMRTKAIALLLGPAGVGLFGVYGAIVDLVATIAGLGISGSGVRQVAAAAGESDTGKIEATIRATRRLSVALGALGGLALIALAIPVSRLSFGSPDHAIPIMVLGAAVFLRCIAWGEGALLQGLRRIRELALTSIVGAVAATVGSIVLVWWVGEAGITAAIVLTAAASLVATLWFSRRVGSGGRAGADTTRLRDLYSSLLTLGVVFMVSALGGHVGAYAVRTTVFRTLGADAAGHYQAAWTIGSLYIGVILAAMTTDYYPRLVAAISDPKRCNAIVNEQVRASLLLAGPGVLATLTFSSPALSLLYSPEFRPAAETLRWIGVGMALRIVTWPLGFMIVASGRKVLMLTVELVWTGFYILCSWMLIERLGLVGAGLAFALSYLLHWAMVFPIARQMTRFAWDPENWRLIVTYLAGIMVVTVAFEASGPLGGVAVGSVAVAASVVYASRQAWTLVGSEVLPQGVKRLARFLAKFAPGRRRD